MLAIAHNGNLSNGIMFPLESTFSGGRSTAEYAETRAQVGAVVRGDPDQGRRRDPPLPLADDEFADYETWDQGNLDLSALKEDEMLQYEYARSGLQSASRSRRSSASTPTSSG